MRFSFRQYQNVDVLGSENREYKAVVLGKNSGWRFIGRFYGGSQLRRYSQPEKSISGGFGGLLRKFESPAILTFSSSQSTMHCSNVRQASSYILAVSSI